MLVQGWHLDGIRPAPAHLLYACLKTSNLANLKLCVEFKYTEEAETAEEYLETPFKVLDPAVVQIAFDPEQKTPDGRFFVNLLLVSGGSPCLLDFKFKDVTVFDVADDSPQGFPSTAKLFLSDGGDLSNAANAKLRQKTERTLLMIEAMPKYVIEPEPSDLVLKELAEADDDDLSLSADGKIRIGPDGSWTPVG